MRHVFLLAVAMAAIVIAGCYAMPPAPPPPPPPSGRVHISVHRGPTKGHGHHKFAPFAYYVHQPEDAPPPPPPPPPKQSPYSHN